MGRIGYLRFPFPRKTVTLRPMKVRNIIRLTVCTLLLIILFQAAGAGYAYHTQKEKTDVALKAAFRKAFDFLVDEQVNALPYPDGTVTHLIYTPADSIYLQNEELYSFYTSQQTSAILQDAYGQAEMSLDALRLELEKELCYDGVEGEITIRKFDTHTGKTLQCSPEEPERQMPGLHVTSEKAYLREAKGIAVEAHLHQPFYHGYMGRMLGFYITTLALALAVIIPFFIRTRKLQREQTAINEQRQEFYRQAKEMESPVRQMKSDIEANHWEQAHETGQQLLAVTEATLTHAKQKDARAHSVRSVSSLCLLGFALAGALLLTFLWSSYIYREQRSALAHEVQVCFEEAFVEETARRYHRLTDSLPSHPRIKAITEFCNAQYDSWLSEAKDLSKLRIGYAFVKRGGMNMEENARIRRAYNNQDIFADAGCAYVSLDSVYMDSVFNAFLQEKGLPAGRIHFFNRASERLMGKTLMLTTLGKDLLTRPVAVNEERTQWMEGIVPAPLAYIFRSAWYLFVSLRLLSLFTLACIAGLWYVGRRLRKLGQFREDFTYSMIHDMKSPLQSVLMGTQIMASGRMADKPDRAEGLRKAMLAECEHLLALSGRVVTLTQMERGELELHRTSVALRPLLEDLAGKFRLKAPKPVTFDITCDERLSATADAFCLREVLSNLIDNAVKYSREEVSIRLSAEVEEDKAVSIRVRDNGIGIPLRDQQRIFGKFERVASDKSTAKTSGFGLGLNFVWQVVRAHGGSIRVESDGRSFSEFTLQLPE